MYMMCMNLIICLCVYVCIYSYTLVYIQVLCPLIELSVDENLAVKTAANTTLLRISLYCGYNSVIDMYRYTILYCTILCISYRSYTQ